MARYIGMNPDGPGVKKDKQQLWQSVRDVLTTPLGSRIMRRDYGSVLPDLIDAPQNSITRMQLMSAAVIALTRWEPRIALSAVDVSWSKTGRVEMYLSGLLTETLEATSGTVTLRSDRDGNS